MSVFASPSSMYELNDIMISSENLPHGDHYNSHIDLFTNIHNGNNSNQIDMYTAQYPRIDNSAQQLFARSNLLFDSSSKRTAFDPVKQSKYYHDVMIANLNRTKSYGITDMNGYIDDITNQSCNSIYDVDGKCLTDIVSQTSCDRWVLNSWLKSRMCFLESLGHRSQSSNVRASTAAAVSSSSSVDYHINKKANKNNEDDDQYLYHINTGSSVLADLHADIFKEIFILDNSIRRGDMGGSSILGVPATRMLKAVLDYESQRSLTAMVEGMTKEDINRYKLVLEMVADMVGESRLPVETGYFTPVALQRSHVQANVLKERQLRLTSGAKRYFEYTCDCEIKREIQDLQEQRAITFAPINAYGSSSLRELEGYAHYKYQVGLVPRMANTIITRNSIGQDIPLWTVIYYCLRVGDIASAAKVAKHEGVEADVAIVLETLSKCKDDFDLNASIVNGSDSNSMDNLHDRMMRCRKIYNDERKRYADDQCDAYKEVVLNLLGLIDSDDMFIRISNINNSGLEDCLWSQLWYIEWLRMLDGVVKFDSYSEDILYEKILSFGGAKYFDQDGSEPFTYILVLLACQRFGDGIAYLWEAAKAFPAVQLMSVFLYYGLILPHNALVDNPPYRPSIAAASSSAVVAISASLSDSIFRDLKPSTIFNLYYSNSFRLSNAFVPFYYSLCFKVDWSKQGAAISPTHNSYKDTQQLQSELCYVKLIKQLLMTTSQEQMLQLVGAKNTPRRGVIDRYIHTEKVNQILKAIAQDLAEDHFDIMRSLTFYKLAGMYVEVLETFINQLSSVIVTSSSIAADSNSKSDYWFDYANEFYDLYIAMPSASASVSTSRSSSNINTHSELVVKVQQVARLDLLDMFKTILSVGHFKVLLTNKMYVAARDLLDDIDLIPTDMSRVDEYVDQFVRLPRLHRVMDKLLVMALECIRCIYHDIKYDMSSGKDKSYAAELKQCKQRQECLMYFSNQIRHSLIPDTLFLLNKIDKSI